ncbi:lasso peptide biosynthesis B2 protein [Polluticoccus soli]|uniref:lasso peptide biosynthesis B2 protein n=1 Tax=Polluticoccus soli TaxID=3034150 RepID=UPI0023E0AAAD|nr:lasso peptide biosynthesis B2 protein [Flavipsychrobacter sp. JY13-12]
MRFNAISKYRRLSLQEKVLLTEVVLILLIAKLLILFVPFKKLAPYFGALNSEGLGHITETDATTVAMVRKMIVVGATKVPWKSVCLDRALTAMIMLNRRRIPNTLCLGVRFNVGKSKLDAHAWIRCNNEIFIGGARSKYYNVVAFFSKY